MNNRLKKFGLAAAAVAIIASCSMSTKMDAALERDAESASQLKEVAKVPTKTESSDIIRVKNDIWLGDTSEVEFEGDPLPSYLEKSDGITLISNRPISLFEVGDMINKTTAIKVRYGAVLSEDVQKAAAESSSGQKEGDDPDWISPQKMQLSYKGPLSGLMEEISSRFGVWWKYEKKEINIYKYITKTFVLYSLPSKSTMNVKIGGQGEGSSSASLDLTTSAEFDLWKNIETSIKGMIDEKSKMALDPANGTISLTATPDDIRRVAKYVNEQNVRLARQVAISVKVLQVSINDSDKYGAGLLAEFTGDLGGTTSRFGLGSASSGLVPTLVTDATTGITSLPALDGSTEANMVMNIFPDDWNIGAAIQALSTQNTVSVVTSGTVTTLNNKPAPIQVVTRQSYISEMTREETSSLVGTNTSTVTTEELETGFTMETLPRIMEHGRMLLMFNLTLSELLELQTVCLAGMPAQEGESCGEQGYVQNPIVESRGFTQEVAMTSGQSLVLTGFDRNRTLADKSGVGSASNSLLGGTANASKTRNLLVIILTPVVLESPLMPESRMKEY